MSRRKPVRALLVAAAATTALLGMSGIPASAATSTCSIGEFPAIQASQSGANIACTFTNSADPALNEVSYNFTYHDFENAAYHQGAARKVTLTAATAIGGTVLTAAAGNFTATDINHPVGALSVTNTAVVPARAFIKAQTATTATMNIPAAVAIPIGTVVSIDNDTFRTVDTASFTAASATITSTTANFTAADIGKTISATNIPEYKTITAVASTTSATMSAAATTTGAAQVATIGGSTTASSARSVSGATQTTTVITSATAAFRATDVGLPVSGTGLAVGARITAVTATTATVTPAGTANAIAHDIVIGAASLTAPKNGSAAVTLGTILDLTPALVAGQNACSLNKPEGLALSGQWMNPGSFVTGAGTQPAGQVIAQILFKTSVTSFSGWVVQVPTDASKPVPHYDVAFPLLPISLAKCGAPNAVNVLAKYTMLAGSSSQSELPTGVGRPSSAQIRYLGPNGGVTTATTAKLVSNLAAPKNWVFTGNCSMAGAPLATFNCGS